MNVVFNKESDLGLDLKSFSNSSRASQKSTETASKKNDKHRKIEAKRRNSAKKTQQSMYKCLP